MIKSPKIHSTSNYDLFKYHPLNRPTRVGLNSGSGSQTRAKNKKLFESMRKHGFNPFISTLTVWKDPEDGKYEISFGHNRFTCAKQLGIPVYFTISDVRLDPRIDDGSTTAKWSGNDYVTAFAREGLSSYKTLKHLSDTHKMPVKGIFAGILAGNFIKGNKDDLVKGTYTVKDYGLLIWSRTLPLLKTITDGDDDLRKAGFLVSTRALSVLAAIASVAKFDPDRMVRQMNKYPAHVQEQTSRAGYLAMFEDLYNKGVTRKAKYLFSSDVKQRVDAIAGKSVTQWWAD